MNLEELQYRYYSLPLWGRVCICCILAAIPISYYYYTEYSLIETKKLNQQQSLTTIQSKIKLAKQHQATLPQMQASVQLREKRLMKMSKYLPETTPLDEILHTFASIAREEGVLMTSFIPGSESIPKKELKYAERSIALQVKGGFQDTAIFFDRILHLDRVIHLTDLNMSGIREGVSTPLNSNAEDVAQYAEIVTNVKVLVFRGLSPEEIKSGTIKNQSVAVKTETR